MLHITFMKHKLFIIEGFDRIGKSTTLKALSRRLPQAYVYVQATDNGTPEESMPSYREDVAGFTKWLDSYLSRQVDDLLAILKEHDSDIIMARLFISDFVYSSMFDRPEVAKHYHKAIQEAFDIVHIVLTWKDYEEYKKRCKACGEEVEYTEDEFADVQYLYSTEAPVKMVERGDLPDNVKVISGIKANTPPEKIADVIESKIGRCMDPKHYIKSDKIDKMFKLFWDLYENPDLDSIREYLSDRKNLDKGIIIAGVGKNFYIAEKIYKTFISMGIKCQALDCVHALHGDLGMVDGQLIFFLSKSGNTEEMVTVAKTLNMLRDRGIKDFKSCGFFLNNKPNYIEYDWMITPGKQYTNDDIYEFDSRNLVPSLSINIMQMILDDLGVEMFEKNNDLYEGYKYNHMGGTNGKRLGVDKELEKAKTI